MDKMNNFNNVERSLDSVLRQTVRPHVIVVDDASTDGTAELVEAYAKRTDLDVELLRLPENLGAGLAKRVGIQRSKADFIIFLDLDDILPRKSRGSASPYLAACTPPAPRRCRRGSSRRSPGRG